MVVLEVFVVGCMLNCDEVVDRLDVCVFWYGEIKELDIFVVVGVCF